MGPEGEPYALRRRQVQSYRPEIREVPVHCFADGLWISGAICVPGQRALVDHLNQGDPFVKLRKAELAPGNTPFGFLALRRAAVSLVIPLIGGDRIEQDRPMGNFSDEGISCILPGGTVTGRVRLLSNLRVSDHVMRTPGFMPIHDCRIHLHEAGGDAMTAEPLPVALINVHCVVGVSEPEGAPPGAS